MNNEERRNPESQPDAIDSRPETWKHIHKVQQYLNKAIVELQKRQLLHDQSKLEEPELSLFNAWTPRLSGVTYGSKEYEEFRAYLKPALDHHYARNRHHPEYWRNGIKDMNLVDLIEMLADWVSSSQRHTDGNIRFSIEKNQQRFNYSDELKQIFLNTLNLFE